MLKGKRALRRVAAVSIALVLLWLLSALAVPPLLKWQLQQHGSELLGRDLSIERIRFTPWNLRLVAEGIALAGAPEGAAPGASAPPPQAQIGRLVLNLEASSLWKRAPVVSELELHAPRLHVKRRADGGTDLDDILARLRPSDEAPQSDGPPPRFALHNLRLAQGALDYEDEARGARHALRELELALPFISSLPADVATQVQPRLAFVLDGSRFDSGASATPFSQHRDSSLDLRFDALELAPFAAYLPPALKLRDGRLGAQLQLRFHVADDGAPRLDLQGRIDAQDLALHDASGAPLLAWKSLQVELQPSQPLQRRLALGPVLLDGLTLHAGRDARGRPLPALGPDGKAGDQAADKPSDKADAAGWTVSAQEFQVKGAALHWRDEALKLRWRVEQLDARAQALQWPLDQDKATPFEAQAQLLPEDGGRGIPPAGLKLSGEAAAAGGTLGFELNGLPLAPLAPVLAQALRPRPEGRLGAQGRLRWTSDGLQTVELAQARLEGLRLLDPDAPRAAAPLAAWDALALEAVRVALPRREAEIGRLRLQAPMLQLARDAQGRLNAASWGPPAAAAAPAPAAARPAAAESGGWKLKLRQLQIDDGRLVWRDAQPAPQAPPVELGVSRLQLALQDLQWPLAAGQRAGSLALELREIRDPRRRQPEAARVQWRGRLQPEPLALDGRWRVERLPLHLLQSYAGADLPLVLRHAEGGFDGELGLRNAADGLRMQVRGDALLGGVQAVAARDRASGDELLSWQALTLKGIDAAVQPGSKPRVQLQSATLSDFYARVVITEEGRFNLQDLRGRPVELDTASTAAPADAAASAPAPAPAPSARGNVTVGPPVSRTRELPLELALGTTTLVNGRVDFNDRFVRPNYSAELSELGGTLGPLRSDQPGMAALSLRGRAAGSALLDIQGTLNPLANPPELDLRARATGLELPPLTPYAAKYAGYAIERGKLSVDLGYRIDNEGRLQASNRLTLNQLTFGERIESPSATKLPVLLAVSLLKDRNGNIDLDLPISGSLNDPQFSIGGIVLKLIGNLLLKAVTSPFALLAGAGGPDLSRVPFDPGSALPSPAGQAVLERAAEALKEKSSLQTTITGEADPVAEGDAIRRVQLEARIRAEQRRLALRAGTSTGQAELAPPTPQERERLLRRVYADTALPDKPRNFIGLARELPAAEVEQRLLAAIAVTPEGARALAVQRALAVRDALGAAGVDGQRLFVAAPRLREPEKDDGDADGRSGPWTPQVELSLR